MEPESKKSDGYILLIEPYPHDEETFALQLGYAESEEEALNHQYKFRRFFLKRDKAELLLKGLQTVLSAPDAETAWEQIASNAVDPDCSNAVNSGFQTKVKNDLLKPQPRREPNHFD